jgi:DNA-binding NtrC family response regulator
MSRAHATFEVQGDAVRIVDTSSNGTFVAGERVAEATLTDGSVVRVGDTMLVVRWVPGEVAPAQVPELLGVAPAMDRLRGDVQMVAPTDARVLILGESGTGKELVARALHVLSGCQGDFVPVNCSAIPENLAESQFFGHVAGAFTGARTDHEGYFRAATHGTLFLDEIGELPPALQPKLLRALEEQAVTPVGFTAPVPCPVRVVAATNRDLEAAASAGDFRGDLYARLAEITVRTPPLCERPEDVLPILESALGQGAPRLEADLVEALLLHPWPYNVRELMKVAKELRIRGEGADELTLSLVSARLSRPEATSAAPQPPGDVAPAAARPEEVTRESFVEVLTRYSGNISHVARALGRSRRQVYRYLETYELELDDFRD